jgi:hypothetical protein
MEASNNNFTDSKTFRAVADNGYARIHIKSSATKSVCFTWSFTTEGKCYLGTYAGSTYSNDGIVQAIFNRALLIAKTATCQIFHTPTVNVLGGQRGDDFVGAGGNIQTQAGGSGVQGIETCLPPNADILFSLQNVSGNAKDINIIINFYEN